MVLSRLQTAGQTIYNLCSLENKYTSIPTLHCHIVPLQPGWRDENIMINTKNWKLIWGRAQVFGQFWCSTGSLWVYRIQFHWKIILSFFLFLLTRKKQSRWLLPYHQPAYLQLFCFIKMRETTTRHFYFTT